MIWKSYTNLVKCFLTEIFCPFFVASTLPAAIYEDVDYDSAITTVQPNLMLMRGMNRLPPGPNWPWIRPNQNEEEIDDETTTTTTTTTTETAIPTTTSSFRRFNGYNTNTGLDRTDNNREDLETFIQSNRPAWADSVDLTPIAVQPAGSAQAVQERDTIFYFALKT